MILTLTVAVICGVLFVYLYREWNIRGKQGRNGISRPDRNTSVGLTSAHLIPHDGIGPMADAVFPVTGISDEGATSLRKCLIDGMRLIFSDEAIPAGRKIPLLTIDTVHNDVREHVMSCIASLKNIDTVSQLQRIMSDPKTTMTDLSVMITSNPLLSAKILQVANSPFYGMAQRLNSISHAIMIIGMVNLKVIICHEGILQVLNEKDARNNPITQAVWQHANYASIFASYFHYLFGGLNMGNLFTLGLLHDIGKFIMMRLTPLHDNDNEQPAEYSPHLAISEEEEIYGINHALVGRLALQRWGLSPLIVETVSLHHAPVYYSPADLGLDDEVMQYLLVMFLADQAARLYAGKGCDESCADRLHPAYNALIDWNKLFQIIVDKSLMGQLREADEITGIYT